jgi:hypothetical protein
VTAELFVFGRTEYAEPLTERGEAGAGEDVLATHPGVGRAVAFPSGAVRWIIRGGEDAE